MKEEERDNEAAAASALIAEPGWEPLEHLLALQTWDDEDGDEDEDGGHTEDDHAVDPWELERLLALQTC